MDSKDFFSNLKKINQEQAFNLSKFFVNSNGNIILFGKKGTGKTSIAFQVAKELKLKANYINLSVVERSDICGFPDINSDSNIISYKSPYFLPPLEEGKKTDSILIFDEIDKCPSDIQAPLLEILQFKTINGKPINAKACILTANLLSERTYSNLISSALLDRCSKYILDFSFQNWIEWCKSNNINDLIVSFLISNPDFAHQDDNDSYACSSPRSWVNASLALEQAKKYKLTSSEDISNILAGFVGEEISFKFLIWFEFFRKHENLIKSIIDSGKMADLSPLHGTEKLVFIVSACSYAKNQVLLTKKLHYLENLVNLLDSQKIDNEIIVHAMLNSFSFDIISKNHLYKCLPFFDLFKKISTI